QPDDLRVASSRSKNGNSEDADTGGAKNKLGLSLGELKDELAERFGLDKGQKGALVLEVEPKSPAAREGIRPGDLITEIGKTQVTTPKEAREALAKADLAKGVRLYVVSREGSRFVFVQSDAK